MNRGWIILAMTNGKLEKDIHTYYRKAYNLAVSLKADQPANNKRGTKYPITLVCCGHGLAKVAGQVNPRCPLTYNQWKVFDEIKVLKDMHNIGYPFYAKTTLNQYSPYDESIYMDADSLAIGDPDKIFEQCKDIPYAAIVVRTGDKAKSANIQMSWTSKGDLPNLYDYYGVGETAIFTELNTSCMYWSKKGKDIFTLAEHFYAAEFYPDFHGYASSKEIGHYPDELAFETAMLVMGYEIPFKFNPMFMDFTHMTKGYFSWTQNNQKYPLMTYPGGRGHTAGQLYTLHNNLTANFAATLERQMGLKLRPHYKDNDALKAANKPMGTRYNGIRKRSRPAAIKKLIEKYNG